MRRPTDDPFPRSSVPVPFPSQDLLVSFTIRWRRRPHCTVRPLLDMLAPTEGTSMTDCIGETASDFRPDLVATINAQGAHIEVGRQIGECHHKQNRPLGVILKPRNSERSCWRQKYDCQTTGMLQLNDRHHKAVTHVSRAGAMHRDHSSLSSTSVAAENVRVQLGPFLFEANPIPPFGPLPTSRAREAGALRPSAQSMQSCLES